MAVINRIGSVGAAVLCIGVAAVHIYDQGGLTSLADPAFVGWGYRAVEVAGVVVAGLLVFAAGAAWNGTRARLAWTAAALVGLGPLVGYILTRTTGLPGDSEDIGNWGEPAGVASLIIEGALIALAVACAARASRRHSATGVTATRTPVAAR